MLLFIYFLIFTIEVIHCCDPERIHANVSSHSFDEPHNDRCEFIVDAHPTKSIQISLECGYDIRVWLQFQVDGVDNEIYVTRLYKTRNCYSTYYYVSPQNVGIRMEVYNMNDNYIELNIERGEEKNQVCKFPYIVVGLNNTLIQEKTMDLARQAICAYRLVPDISNESSNEILIKFDNNIDYWVQEHTNGTIGKLKSKSKSEIFPLEVIDLSFSRTSWIPRISANLVHIACSCGDSTFSNFSVNNMISIRSPGFPSANCPLKQCEYTIDYSSTETEVFLFDIKVELGERDHFILIENKLSKEVIRYSKYKPMPTSFALESRDFELKYKASDEILDRFFEVNVTRIPISEECRCTSYQEKVYTNDKSIAFTIPKTCKSVFCSWQINTENYYYSPKRMDVRMIMENPNEDDFIKCGDEKFLGSKLVHQAFYSTTEKPLNIEFRRFNLTNEKDTRLNISWSFVNDCKCRDAHIFLDTNEVKAVKSPNYPDAYCSNTKCSTVITGPNDTFIELNVVDLKLENFHDYLRIYDENNVLISELTGKYENHTIVSLKNVITMVFESDNDDNYKGYLINIASKEKSSSSSHVIVIPVMTVLVVLVIIILFALFKFGVPRKSSNTSVVQYSNYTTESTISININSF